VGNAQALHSYKVFSRFASKSFYFSVVTGESSFLRIYLRGESPPPALAALI
jgi:hypothetical protein